MKLEGRRQSDNVQTSDKNGTMRDANGNRIHSFGQSGQLTRNAKLRRSSGPDTNWGLLRRPTHPLFLGNDRYRRRRHWRASCDQLLLRANSESVAR